MDIVCSFRNVQEMAQAVCESAEIIEGKQFSPRPWNRFEPENTEWWVVPSNDWPAYRYGKGSFNFSTLYPDQILCGLYVEKGLDRIAAEAYPELLKRGLIIDKNWTWFAFLEGLSNGSVARVANMLAHETDNPVIMHVSAWYASDPAEFEPHPLLAAEAQAEECRSPLDSGRVWFTVVDGALEKLEERCIGDVMAPVMECRKLDQLPEAFQSHPHVSWVWFDVYLGVQVRLTRDVQVYKSHWDVSDIWRKLLHPWSQWIF